MKKSMWPSGLVAGPDRPTSMFRFWCDESAANTLTEMTFQTPCDAYTKAVMRIWACYIDTESPNAGAPTGATSTYSTFIDFGISTIQNGTWVPTWRDPGCIANVVTQHQTTEEVIGASGVGIGVSLFSKGAGSNSSSMIYYPGGILIADSLLSAYIKGTGNTAARKGDGILFYTLETLKPEEYFALLSAVSYV